jgi:hypothetical protein
MRLFKSPVGYANCHNCNRSAKVTIQVSGSNQYFCIDCFIGIIADMKEMLIALQEEAKK